VCLHTAVYLSACGRISDKEELAAALETQARGLHLLYMCPHTPACVSACCHVSVLILPHVCPQVLESLVIEVEALRAAEQLPEEDLSLSACERSVGGVPDVWHSPAKLEACNKELEACKRQLEACKRELEACKRELEACKRPSPAVNPRGPRSLQLSLQLPTASKGVQADARRSGAGAGGGRGGGAEAGAGAGGGGGNSLSAWVAEKWPALHHAQESVRAREEGAVAPDLGAHACNAVLVSQV
jgi:hypothetical protein